MTAPSNHTVCKINIGHDRQHVGKDPLSYDEVHGLLVEHSSVWPVAIIATSNHEGKDEETTVAGITGDDRQTLENFIYEVSELLEQECISTLWGPVWRPPYNGEFIGPEADKWTEKIGWDPDWFLDLDGKPLTADRNPKPRKQTPRKTDTHTEFTGF